MPEISDEGRHEHHLGVNFDPKNALETCEKFTYMSPIKPHEDVLIYRAWFEREAKRTALMGYQYSLGSHLQATRINPNFGIEGRKYIAEKALISFGFGRDGQSVTAHPLGIGAPHFLGNLAQELWRTNKIRLCVSGIYETDVERYYKAGFTQADTPHDFKMEDRTDAIYPEVLIPVKMYKERSEIFREINALFDREERKEFLKQNISSDVVRAKLRSIVDLDEASPSVLQYFFSGRSSQSVGKKTEKTYESLENFGIRPAIWKRDQLLKHQKNLCEFVEHTKYPDAHRCFVEHLDVLNRPVAVVMLYTKPGSGEQVIVGCMLAERIPGNAYASIMQLQASQEHMKGLCPVFGECKIPPFARVMTDKMLHALNVEWPVEFLNVGGSEHLDLLKQKQSGIPHQYNIVRTMFYEPNPSRLIADWRFDF